MYVYPQADDVDICNLIDSLTEGSVQEVLG